MASRVVLATTLALTVMATTAAARTPPAGTAMFVVHNDARLCPAPRCGGYWVALANGVRTRCPGGSRRIRCHAPRAFDRAGRRLGAVPEGALVRGAIAESRTGIDELRVSALYSPAGQAEVSGGFYRVVDNGIRCVREPCFSYTVTTVNASTRGPVSSVDLAASGASGAEIARARHAISTNNGLYARGRYARTADGGTTFRALRFYLRAPLPPA